jgi:hypothetical protein
MGLGSSIALDRGAAATVARAARHIPVVEFVLDGGAEIADAMSRLSRTELKEVRVDLRAALEPMAAAARALVHSESGLLARSLKVRLGRGDFPGRYSVFISATATRRAVAKFRSSGVRARVLAAGKATDRYGVFYARPLESGHRNPTAKTGLAQTPAHEFAQPAFDATAEGVAAAAGEKLMDRYLTSW